MSDFQSKVYICYRNTGSLQRVLSLTLLNSLYPFLSVSGGGNNSSFPYSLYSFIFIYINHIFNKLSSFYFMGTCHYKFPKTNKSYSTSLICFPILLPSSCWFLWRSNLPFLNLLCGYSRPLFQQAGPN